MSSVSTLFQNDAPFIDMPKQTYSDAFLANELQIPLDFITFYDKWIFINKDWLYYKKIKHIKMLINELLGVELAKFYDKSTVEYILGKQILDAEDVFFLMSRNFRKTNCQYLLSDQVGIPNFINYDNSLNNLENLRAVCKSDEEYKNLLCNIFKMFAIDFYSVQKDRNITNMMFEQSTYQTQLAPLYDYENSFIGMQSIMIESPLYCSSIFDSDFSVLLRENNNLYNFIKQILSIDMEAMLKRIAEKNSFIIPDAIKAYYIDFDKERKEIVRHL